jgi:hypothetical protein
MDNTGYTSEKKSGYDKLDDIDTDIFNELSDIIKIHTIWYFNYWTDLSKLNICDVDNNRIKYNNEISIFEVNPTTNKKFLKIFDILFNIN